MKKKRDQRKSPDKTRFDCTAKSTVKRATKKCNLFRDIAAKLPTNQACLATRSSSLFFFLIGNQIYSADNTLRIKVVISNLKQFATQRSCLT